MKKHVFYYLALLMIVVTGCQKELSFELGNTPAEGSLQSDVSGDCLPKNVNGIYEATKPLVPATNTITVSVNVNSTGIYTITTDTVNGYYFRATGTFTSLGINTVTLRSNGTPFVAGIDNFKVSYDGTVCDIAVEVLPAGASGPAVFTLVSGGSPVNCASAAVSGTFVQNVPVGLTNYADVIVNVTTIGTYTIRATGGGMIFERTAAFATTGNQTVQLQATGTPTTVGPNTITFDAPFASCSFTVTVSGQASYTINCAGVTVQGTYQVGVALTAANTITIPVTAVATPGVYFITGTVNGMTFSGAGTISAPGNIILTGTGTPATGASPTSSLVLTSPSACTIPITVAAAAGPAVYTINCAGATVQGTYTISTALTAANTITIPVTAVTTPGTWTIGPITINGMTFAGSGNISAPGNIILTGTGTPATGASPTSNLVLTSPSACTIPITVAAAPAGPAVYTINCAGATVQGTYTVNTVLTASNTVTIPVTAVTTPGTWTIGPIVINGMTFSGSGNISAPGNIILTGSGTPTPAAAPTSNLVLTTPSACTIPITVGAAAVVDWSFTLGATTYSGAQTSSTLDNTLLPPYTLIDMEGSYGAAPAAFYMILGDPSGGLMTAGETYRTDIAAPGPNVGYFYFDNLPGLELEASDPTTTPGVNITFTITSHNTTTKTIVGTFSGTAFNSVSAANVTITGGTFKIVYP